jgi:hypothetical protein
MDSQQDKPLGRALEPKLKDILSDFDQVLEKHGFPKVYVVSFTVRPEVAGESLSSPDTICRGNPPICEP